MPHQLRRATAGSAALVALSATVLAASPAMAAAAPAPAPGATVVWNSGGWLDQIDNTTGHWRIEPPGYDVGWAAEPVVSLDPATDAETVLWRAANGRLATATERNRAWTSATTPVAIPVGSSVPSATINEQATMTVVWRDDLGNLDVATRTNGDWTTVSGVAELGQQAAPQVATDPLTGRLDVVYTDTAGDVAMLSKASPTSAWTPSVVAPAADPLSAPVVAMDAGGAVDVLWASPSRVLRLATPFAGGWQQVKLPDPPSPLSTAPSFTLTSTGVPIVVWATASGLLHELREGSGQWVFTDPGVTLSAGELPQVVATPSAVSTSLETRVVATAEGQMGYHDPVHEAFCNKYSYAMGTGDRCSTAGTRSELWCADFAKWVWAAAGASVDSELTPSAASFYSWAVRHHTWHPVGSGYVPRPGDAVVYGMNASHDFAAHVAIVVASTQGRPDVVNGDFNYGVSGVVPEELDEWVGTTSDIFGYASPQ